MQKFSFFVNNVMFQTKCHLSDKANHGLPVNVKSWLERKKSFTKKQKKKKKKKRKRT